MCDLVHRLFEDTAGVANAVRHAGETQRDADGDLLTGDQLLEVDVDDAALERMALDLADQRLRDRCPSTLSSMTVLPAEMLLRSLLDLTGVDGQRLRLAAVAVDDAGTVPA